MYNDLSNEILELEEKLKNKKLQKEKLDKIKELENIINKQKDEIEDLKMLGAKREGSLEDVIEYQSKRLKLFENKSSTQQQQQQQQPQQKEQHTTVKLSYKDYVKRLNDDKEKYINVFLLIKNTEPLHQALDKFFIEKCIPPSYYRYIVDVLHVNPATTTQCFKDNYEDDDGILHVCAFCRQIGG